MNNPFKKQVVQFSTLIKQYIMQKLLLILSVSFFSLTVHAQQTEDDVYVGKSKTYGNFRGPDLTTINPKPQTGLNKNVKPVNNTTTITGTVVKLGWCEDDCLTVWVKKDDGTTVAVGTKDFGFTVPKNIVGKRIVIEGMAPAMLIRDKRIIKKEYQKDIQFAASGVKIIL